PRWRACGSVRYLPSTQGTISSHRYVWYLPVPGELAAAQRGPAVNVDEDAGRRTAACELRIGQLRKVPPEWHAVSPHADLPGQPHDHVDTWVATLRVGVVAGRQVNPQWASRRVVKWVAFQHL